MKNQFFFLIALAIMVVASSCSKEVLPEGDSSLIYVTTPSQKALFSGNDTLYVEPGATIILEAHSDGPTMVGWSWTFSDGNTANGQQIAYTATMQPPTVITMTLTTTDQGGTVYNKTIPIKAVYTLDGLAAVVVVSSNKIGNDLFSVVMAFHKNGMLYNGNKFFYIGNVTTPAWTRQEITPADTNWIFVNGALVAPEAGDVGKYVAVRMNLNARDYEMGVGKIVNGDEWWGNFWGAFVSNRTMIKFTLKDDGVIVPKGDGGGDPLALPGKVGDEIIRAEIYGENLHIYMNNATDFNTVHPFVKSQNPNGTWVAPNPQTAVEGHPKWGWTRIPLDDMRIGNMVTFRFGPQIGQPLAYNEAAKNSNFWDPYYKVLKIVCHKVKSANLLGEEQSGWIIASGVPAESR
jgi:hypothetical protein